MRTLLVLLLFAIACKGNHLKLRQLIDFLRTQEVVESKRHEVTADRRHAFTGAVKRHPFTSAAKRHQFTSAVKRHQFTSADKRHEVTYQAKRHEVTAGVKRQDFTPPTPANVPELNLPTSTSGLAYMHELEDEFLGYEEAFLFPGSHYLIDMIRKHCESGMGLKISVEDINDEFEVPDCDIENLGDTFLYGLLQRVQDPDGIALLATRHLMKPMLKERMECPATILDMGFIKLLLAKKRQFMSDDDDALHAFFKDMAPLVHPALEPMADDVATMGVLELHGSIFNETLEFLWKYGLKDLAYASHSIYHKLRSYFHSILDENAMASEMDYKQRLQSALSVIRCPTSSEVIEYHKTAMQRFKDVFATMETAQICLKVSGFLSNYIHVNMPGHQFDTNGTLEAVCDGVKQVIVGIVQEYFDYENFLYSMDISDFEMLTERVFTDSEWDVMEEALRRLNFV